jgi:hypothetical protein
VLVNLAGERIAGGAWRHFDIREQDVDLNSGAEDSESFLGVGGFDNSARKSASVRMSAVTSRTSGSSSTSKTTPEKRLDMKQSERKSGEVKRIGHALVPPT